MSFAKWLRSNSEYYLLCDAQARIARQMGFNPPADPKGLKERFWRQVFVPVYHLLPQGARRAAMQALPGSHRHIWPKYKAPPPMP